MSLRLPLGLCLEAVCSHGYCLCTYLCATAGSVSCSSVGCGHASSVAMTKSGEVSVHGVLSLLGVVMPLCCHDEGRRGQCAWCVKGGVT